MTLSVTRSKKELTAYHEAGHVVAAFRFGHQHEVVSIEPNPARGTAGHSCCEDSDVPEEMVIKLLAGYAAEVEAGGNEADTRASAWSDFEEAQRWLPEGAELPLEEARQFVRENWKAIERFKDELLKHNTLDGQVTDVLMDVCNGDTTEEEYASYTTMFNVFGNQSLTD